MSKVVKKKLDSHHPRQTITHPLNTPGLMACLILMMKGVVFTDSIWTMDLLERDTMPKRLGHRQRGLRRERGIGRLRIPQISLCAGHIFEGESRIAVV
jgi:hypothetical protein